MYAIAFDLVVADTERHHPKGVSQAYADIATTLAQFDFRRVQGSLYLTNDENMAHDQRRKTGIPSIRCAGRI